MNNATRFLAATVVLVAHMCVTTCNGTNANELPQEIGYEVYIRLVKIGQNGEERVLAQPQVSTLADRDVTLNLGGELETPRIVSDKEVVAPLPFGTSAKLRLHRLRPENLVLDIDLMSRRIVNDGSIEAKRLHIQSTGLRMIEPVKLGHKTTIPMEHNENGDVLSRFEFRVTKIDQRSVSAAPNEIFLRGKLETP